MPTKWKRYGHSDGTGVARFAGMFSHLWDSEIDSAVASIVEVAFPYMKKIIDGELPSDLQGLLGCWSWAEPQNSQLCLLMSHAKDKEGYFVAHELAHLLHYSIRPDLFKENSDVYEDNLKEMIAHAGGLLFAPFAQKIRNSVDRLELLYLKKNLHDLSLLQQHHFSPEEDYKSIRTHRGGYKAAEFILFKGVSIRKFVELDVSQAENELAELGYSRGLFIEPEKKEQPKVTSSFFSLFRS